MRKKEDELIFCKTCVFLKKFDQNTSWETRFCEVCADWNIKITPLAKERTIKNALCHLILNAKNDCPFYSTERVSAERLKRLRLTCKIKMAK